MKPRSRSTRKTPPLCGDLGPDDGVDPREDRRISSHRLPDRKTLQLCRQVLETLHYVLSADTEDELLHALDVIRVDPAPDASRLLVTVTHFDPAAPVAADAVLARLAERSGYFRSEVARTISRRKTPVLSFQFLPRSDAPSTQEESHE